MRDITPEWTIDWTACLRTEIPGRKEPDWLQPGDVLFPTRGSQVYGVTMDATATQQKTIVALDHAMQREQHLFERIITQNRQTMTDIADGFATAHTSRIH
ncbi:hypothetical protein AAJCM20276_29560 [Acetobacter aceti]|uniref:Uncharacterized protein n=2 Tax=Acetobacter aceti TaxID=435 RepID=A0A6S6PUL1_ACEAC|nr:hypothetical protein [Acetobacter aceti]BCI68332.1 hypothetical protein AAJCM20276_29560 [Acetobacter aceti]